MRKLLIKSFSKKAKGLSKFLRKNVFLLSLTFLLFSLMGTGFSLFTSTEKSQLPISQTNYSSEINIADSSPLGDAFGLVVPASCPSDLHDNPNYGQGCSTCNTCGACNGGTYQCGGSCSASAPALAQTGSTRYDCSIANGGGTCYAGTADWVTYCNGTGEWTNNTCYEITCCVANQGASCSSAANSCGTTNSGTIQCNGTCSATTAPANPAGYGTYCTSAPNACGYTDTQMITCSGCPATTPANPAGYGNACTSAPNACGSTNSGTVQCNGTCSATTPATPAGYGTSCTRTNSCSQSNTGTILCNGSCSVSAPANPPLYGTTCTSAPNACGQTNTGTYWCNGSCSAVTPAMPGNYGNSCTSTPNACGMTNTGTIQCNGWCSAVIPDNSLCVVPPPTYVCTGTIPPNASMYADDGTGLSANTPYTYYPTDTGTRCQYHCNTGYSWNGSACVATTYSCTGTIPSNASMYAGDNVGLTADTPYSWYSSDTGTRCQFYCNTGYNWNGSACVAPTYSCTGTLPANTNVYVNDDTGLSANTPYSYSASNTAPKCQYSCNSGYNWNGSSCVAAPPTPVTTFTGTYGSQVNQTTLNLPVGGGTVNLNWSVTNAIGGWCTGYSTTGVSGWAITGTGSKPVTGTNISAAVSSTTRFDLDCWNSSGTPAVRRSVQVNVAAVTTVNGVCSTTAETCTSGTYSNSPADTSTNYQWTCLGSGSPVGTNSGTCSAPIIPVTTFTGTYSSQVNQTTINLPAGGGSVNLNWSVTNASPGTCTGYSTTGVAGWARTGTSGKSTVGTNVPTAVASTTRFDLDCWNTSAVPWVAALRQSVTVNVAAPATPTLTICPAAGVSVTVGGPTGSLAAYYNAAGSTNCGSLPGASLQVTPDSWFGNDANIATVTGLGTVTGISGGVSSATTPVQASYSGTTSPPVTITVQAAPSCVSNCTPAQAATVCTGDTYTVNDSCGVPKSCPGSRLCDYNWKEIAP